MSNAFLEELPPFYREIKEFVELSKVVSGEFDKIERSFNQLDSNQFILTMDEASISVLEKDFNILPDLETETLEFRRERIIIRQSLKQPFTFEYLKRQLDFLSGGSDNFSAALDVDNFELEIIARIRHRGGIDEFWHWLEEIVPLNILIDLKNELHISVENSMFVSWAVSYVQLFELTHDFRENYNGNANAKQGTSTQNYTIITATHDFKETYDANNSEKQGTILQGYSTLELK